MTGTLITIGTFDGLHRGHQAVLSALKEESRKRGLKPVAMTFDRHPLSVIAPARAPRLLMDPDDRDRMIRGMGVEVVRLHFDDAVRRKSAAEWMHELRSHYGAVGVMLGYDNRFGCDGRSLDVDAFRRIGADNGLEVLIAPEVEGCSSSAVRKALEEGDTRLAANILGRSYAVKGTVERGRQLGRTIGVPTANVGVPEGRMLPKPGVYAATVDTGSEQRRAVVNIGMSPTVTDSRELRLEAHLLDYAGDLYGQELEVAFDDRIRDERKFDTLAELREQIVRDMQAAAH